MNPGAIKVVSWDVDGTLYSLGRMKWRLTCRFIREVAGGRKRAVCRKLAALRRYRARIETAQLAGGALGGTLQEICRQALLSVEQRWYSRAIRQTGSRAGVTELLAFFAERNIPQVTLSDYQAEYKLESLRLADRFASTYAGECLGFVKPSPVGFERIAADFGIPTDGLLNIGDRADTDGAGALPAGCRCLILGRNFRSFDALLKKFQSLSS